MNLSEQIAEEVRELPEELKKEVLDFILFVERRHATGGARAAGSEPDWGKIRIDTKGWRFDRDEANAR
ncbi:MAG: hypothetical protein KDH88_11275 [Chromatiales bacterium]|nr:hypothetical protein [Chromatiales bacterium]